MPSLFNIGHTNVINHYANVTAPLPVHVPTYNFLGVSSTSIEFAEPQIPTQTRLW
jgi:hypothetical protein